MSLLNSCLKDDADYWKEDVAGKMYATVLTPTLQTLSLKPVADTVEFSFMVNIATDTPPAFDVTLTMMVDTAAVTAYNKRSGKSYKAFPTVLITNPTIKIAAGTRTGMVYGKLWGADVLDVCDNFMAAISIKSVSEASIAIPSNMKSYLLSLPIANPWAGTYYCSGYRLHPSYPGQRLGVDQNETFSTVDCKTVIKVGTGDYSSYNCQVEVTRDIITVEGVDCYKVLVTVIDPSNGTEVAGGQYDTFTGDASFAPVPVTNDVNYYNPDTHTFVLNYFYNTAAPRIIYEVLSR